MFLHMFVYMWGYVCVCFHMAITVSTVVCILYMFIRLHLYVNKRFCVFMCVYR